MVYRNNTVLPCVFYHFVVAEYEADNKGVDFHMDFHLDGSICEAQVLAMACKTGEAT